MTVIPDATPAVGAKPTEGGLLIRLWTEQDAAEPLRARVMAFEQGSDEPLHWAVVSGEAGILNAVRTWLDLHREDSCR